jgi:hypothetical protein
MNRDRKRLNGKGALTTISEWAGRTPESNQTEPKLDGIPTLLV